MTRPYLLCAVFIMLVSGLAGIDDEIIKKFEKARIHKDKEIVIVRFEPMKPDIERYQKKTETDVSRGYFQMYKNNLRKANRILLNKWLKEFK
jgi:hypothetical protein